MKHMINSVVFAGFFVGRKVSGVLYHHDGSVIPLGTAADRAEFLICKSKTFFAVAYIISGSGHGSRQLLYLFLWHIDNVKCKSLGRLCAYSGKPGQFFDQFADLAAVVIH